MNQMKHHLLHLLSQDLINCEAQKNSLTYGPFTEEQQGVLTEFLDGRKKLNEAALKLLNNPSIDLDELAASHAGRQMVQPKQTPGLAGVILHWLRCALSEITDLQDESPDNEALMVIRSGDFKVIAEIAKAIEETGSVPSIDALIRALNLTKDYINHATT